MNHSNLVIKNNEVVQTDSEESVDGVVAQKVIITNPSGWQTLHSPSHQNSYGHGFPMIPKKDQSSLEILPSPQTIELVVHDQDKPSDKKPESNNITSVIQAQTTPGLDLRDVHHPELYEAQHQPTSNELKMQVVEPMLVTQGSLQKNKIVPRLKTLVAKPDKARTHRKKNKSLIQGQKKEIFERQKNEDSREADLTYEFDNANTITKDQTRVNESQTKSREHLYTSETRQTRKLSIVQAVSPIASKNIDFTRLQSMISDVSIEMHPQL